MKKNSILYAEMGIAMLELEEVLKEWEKKGHYGSVADRLERTRRWEQYYTVAARRHLGRPYETVPSARIVTEFMQKLGILQADSTLLDIGCGIGNYTIEFAKCCKTVTALDTNAVSLSVVRERAHACGLSNVKILQGAWEAYHTEECFDVTFCAMCPAICNYEELLRLERKTKQTACLLTVTRGSYEKCRKALMSGLPLKAREGMVTEALYYYVVLYLMGRQPSVECFTTEHTVKVSLQDMIERYTPYFQIFGVDASFSVPYMKQYFAQNSIDGYVEDECKMNYALVYWNI